MNAPFDGAPAAHESARTIAVVSAGTSDPSTSTMLADRVAGRAAEIAAQRGIELRVRTIDLRSLAADVTTALVSQHVSPALQEASDALRDADALIAATPVYKAGASGLFTSFFQVLDNDLLIGTPVVLAATAGSARHALVVDDQLRGLFAYLRTVTVPTSLFASPDDWTSRELGDRIGRSATELVALIDGGFREAVRGEAWGAYQHSFGSAGGTELGIELDTDLMRLATGGA
ncbi:CE1759 family FMN reductase [Leucobacter ruminantium]|uniref:NAD(P)H-dependent oxidoreductase n=1 Tax=Leucobacter ruminantium TaxID=1289170 RepID=A0A939LVL6_9MICO|nr:CE1759 family FMN reductase [Leucobacter ruminantium]MBO1805594.1 NAD(P)H-dependent oxidoreductase [Leucobacter ruminantium]